MLEVRNLAVNYGKIRAVQDVSLTVGKGEIVALIGANGAGKSSTMHAICGIVRPARGTVRFEGTSITALSSHHIVRRGIAQVPEGRMIFAGLTIEENLLVGGYAKGNRKSLRQRMDRLLDRFPVLRPRLAESASNLSGGQLQILALARGLMAEPKLLMLDEPSLGLSPIAAQEVFALIKTLPAQGVTVLLVEQNVRQALAIADRGYVIESGRVILGGASPELMTNDLLVSAYLGVKREVLVS